MARRKAKKISLNEFLGDSALGSWADEMESLPSAPAVRTDEEQARGNDRFGRRGDDFLSSRPDRQGPPREDLPLPTQPPYTAFIGNLAFDLTEQELDDFFASSKTKSVKIIKDREEKPKGFGYIEFEDLDGLKDALAKSGSNFSGRTIRVSVAEPPKERSGFSGSGFEDDAKFDNPWRRDGPLPPSADSRDSSRRRFDGPPVDRSLPSVSEGPSDWRSSRPAAAVVRTPTVDTDSASFRRKGSGFSTPVEPSPADKEEVWAIGSKFKPAPPTSDESGSGSRFGSIRGRADIPAAKEEEIDWRGARPKPVSRGSVSPNSSTPPTPQLSRRKLELLPRSGNVSNVPSPLSSPKIGPTPPVSGGGARSSPFGAARPVDVTGREKEVTEKVEKEREIIKEKLSMSRTNSRSATERPGAAFGRTRTPPPGSAPQSPNPAASTAPTVRPTLSFASAAAKKENVPEKKTETGGAAESKEADAEVGRVAEVISEVTI
ncbi:hypothetical protein B0H14DRAFT_2776667 [Mycena olivaceomarginata]|nr:hypothetical protein B0H14DRAFT_2776667 [Mycena olivaceomarginata]